MSINPPTSNNGYVPPASQSPLSVEGHSLNVGLLTCNEGQWSYVSEVIRTQYQARIINNFQMLTRGVWSSPTGIGWQPQRAAVFNSGAAFMDFGVFEDFGGNQTMLFQVGGQVYSYNLATQTETAYNAPLTGLSTSLANLPCMRSFIDQTGQVTPMTIYTNGSIQPVEITGTAAANVLPLPFVGTPLVTNTNPNGGQFDTSYPISTFTVGTMIANYPTAPLTSPGKCCLGNDGNVWFNGLVTGSGIGNISPLGVVTTFAAADPHPTCICNGPDGRLWCGYLSNAIISATTTAGVTTPYTITVTGALDICSDGTFIYVVFGTTSMKQYTTAGTLNSTMTLTHAAYSCFAGPDGRIWTGTNSNFIQATVPAGATTVYTTGLQATASTNQICAGPGGSGNMYFLDAGTNAVGVINTVTGTISEVQTPTNNSQPQGICLGSDNNIWFTYLHSIIARLNVTTNVITEFTGPPSTTTLFGICVGSDSNLWFCEPSGNAIGTMLLGSANLRGIVTGPDNRLWFTEFATQSIAAITTTGTITTYPLPTTTAVSGPIGITTDGTNLWFTAETGNYIGMMTTAGVVTEYALTTAASAPVGICYNSKATGGDGNIWFTEMTNNKIAKIVPPTGGTGTPGTITEYSAGLTANCLPIGICAANGILYFCESATSANKIGSCTTSGTITEFNVPTAAAVPSYIALGSDGRLWFTEASANKIGAMTVPGVFSEYIVPTASSKPEGITLGGDGNMYFTEAAGNNIGKITPIGAISEFAVPVNNAQPFGITNGPDQSIWFTMNGTSEIGNFLYGGSGNWPGVFQLTKKTYSMPLFCAEFNQRMAYFGFAPGSNAAYDVLISNQGSPSRFVTSVPIQATDAVTFTIPGLGLPTGLTSFRLTNTNNQEVLVLGFQRGIAVVMGNGVTSDATTYQATILTKDYGLMSNRAFNQVQNDLYYMSTNGIRTFSNLTVNANLLNAALTFNMQDVIQSIVTLPITGSNLLYNCQAFSVHHRNTLEMQFWFPTITDAVSSTYENQHAIIMNYNVPTPTPQAITPVFSTKSNTAVACGIEFQGVMYGGGYDGILQQHYTGNTYNGVPIPGTIDLALVSGPNIQGNIELRQGEVITEGQNQLFNVTSFFYTKMQDGTMVRTMSPEGVQTIGSPAQGLTILGGSTQFLDWTLGYSAFPSDHIRHVYFEATGEGPYCEFLLTTNGLGQSLDFAALAYVTTMGGLRP